MIQLSIKINIPGLCRLEPDGLRQACRAAGNGVAEQVRRHFRALPGERFWNEAADATRVEESGRDIEVWVEKRGVALQLHGGAVLPGKGVSSATGAPTRCLAIPASKGITEMPGRYAPLAFIPIRKGHLRGLLLPGETGEAKRRGRKHKKGESIIRAKHGEEPLFRLVDKTTHAPHPEVLPGMDRLRAAAARKAARYMELFG